VQYDLRLAKYSKLAEDEGHGQMTKLGCLRAHPLWKLLPVSIKPTYASQGSLIAGWIN